MYAVIKTGGKQHKVKAGDVIEVEKLVHDGGPLTFQPILVVDDDGKTHVGQQAAKATVTATPLGEQKGDKIKVFKYRPKTGYSKKTGHRQMYTLLEIGGIELKGETRARAKVSASDEDPAAEASSATDTSE